MEKIRMSVSPQTIVLNYRNDISGLVTVNTQLDNEDATIAFINSRGFSFSLDDVFSLLNSLESKL